MKTILPLLTVFFLASCQSRVAPPKAQPEPEIFATVNTIPEVEDVVFEGKTIGRSPVKLKVRSIDQLANGLSVANAPDGSIELKIRHIANNEVAVTLVLGKSLSQIASRPPAKPALLLNAKQPEAFPPELAERVITIMATVGEDGRAKACRIISSGLSTEATKFIADFVRNELKWNPAIADDGKNVASKINLMLSF